ncbi:MAG: TonB-dependent receptor [Flavobacteriaceae bacterium]|nr:TonB-dependent receptor [Flavobacteriaceae bacterium]|tara:strand:- start:5931 stop:8369 length:2439 start_codon:yes stop_codon:yes gene_type:complete
MIRNTTLIFIFFLITLASFGQSGQIVLSGIITDAESSEPLPYATVSVYNRNGDLADGGIADENGVFKLNLPPNDYSLNFEYIGFESVTIDIKPYPNNINIGTVKLISSFDSLEGVDVVGQSAEVEIRLDKRVYNVSKNNLIRGGTVSDVLENVPSVSVDIDGNIELRGNNNVRILVDGKPSGLIGLGGIDAITRLPAESIEKVEVITSPSARYQAEGTTGIINIILTKRFLKGLNGVFNLSAGRNDTYSGSANLNYRKGKFNFFTNSGYSDRTNKGRAVQDNVYSDPLESVERYVEERQFNRRRQGFNVNIGLDYQMTEKTSLTMSYLTNERDGDDSTINEQSQYQIDGVLITNRYEKEIDREDSNQFSVDFEHQFNKQGHKLTATLQTEKNDETETSDINSFFENGQPSDDSEINRTVENQEQNLAQLDYVFPIDKNTQLEAGYRGTDNKRKIDFEVQIIDENDNATVDENLSNVLDFEQEVHALYSQYGKKFNTFSFLAGLRFENTRIFVEQLDSSSPLNNKSYNDYFPTLNLGWEISPTASITLGYNRRISRPNAWTLNPFQSRSSKTSYFQGNPKLDPSYSNGIDIGYLKQFKKVTLNSSVYYRKSTDAVSRVAIVTDETVFVNGIETPVIRRLPINLGTEEQFGVELNTSLRLIKGMRTNASVNLFRRIEKGNYQGISYDSNNTSWSGNLSNSYRLPFAVQSQFSVRYRGPNESSFGKSKGFLYTDLALSKDILNDNATINFRFSDLFNTGKYDYQTITPVAVTDGIYQRREPTYTLTFTYRFRQEKNRQRGRRGSYGQGDFGEFEL